jgi:hypothetical protein
MASGLLGSASLSAATNTTLYTVPSAKTAALSVNFCNRNETSVTVRLAVGTSATPAAADWMLYDVVIAGDGSLERSGIVLDASKLVVVYSSAANVSVQAYGYED